MLPTEILMQEHRVIEQVLDCLEAMAKQAESGDQLDQESASQALDFFANFADRCHHGKEEDCLFPMLEEKGFSREQGPTGVMMQEHDTGRQHVQGMAKAIESINSGETSAVVSFVSHAKSFIALLRDHIQKEDHCLFQMANQALTQQEQTQLMDSFNHVEHHDMGPGTHEKYLEIAAQLAKKFGVTCRVSDTSPGAHCCGHH